MFNPWLFFISDNNLLTILQLNSVLRMINRIIIVYTMNKFIHLRCHTNYSIAEGCININKLGESCLKYKYSKPIPLNISSRIPADTIK